MCSPFDVRIIESTSTMSKLRTVKIDTKGAFLQTGSAQSKVYVIPHSFHELDYVHRALLSHITETVKLRISISTIIIRATGRNDID